jgi:hypothetical protein
MTVVIMAVFVLLVASPRARRAVAGKTAETARRHPGTLVLLAVVAAFLIIGTVRGHRP